MKKFLILLLSMIGLNACADAQENKFTDMDVQQFADYLNKDKSVQLVDVRTPDEYADGHIRGAKDIDIYNADFLPTALKTLDKSRPVAVYCRSGKRSADAAAKLASDGYRVTNLEGGILAWTAAHRPVEK